MGASEDVLGFDGPPGESVLRDGAHSADQMAQIGPQSALDAALSDDAAGQQATIHRLHWSVVEFDVYQLFVIDAVFYPQAVDL